MPNNSGDDDFKTKVEKRKLAGIVKRVERLDNRYKPATLIIRCKKCGHESITHKDGKNVQDDFIFIKGENIFKHKHLCPICKSDEKEFDHDKKTCRCESCVNDRMIEIDRKRREGMKI